TLGAGSAAGDTTRIDDAVRRFASRQLDRSRAASEHAWVLAHVVERYPQASLRSLDEDARADWMDLLRVQAAAFEREVQALERELQPSFRGSTSIAGDWAERTPPDRADADRRSVSRLAADLIALDRARDAAMRSAFAVSADGDGVSAIHTDSFWRALTESLGV